MTAPLSDAEQVMLRDAVRTYLAKDDAPRWFDFIDRLGIGRALLDAQQGAIIAEEIGRARVHLPLAEVATAAWLLDRCNAPVPPATAIATLAWAEPGLRYDFAGIETRARRNGDGWRLEGTKAVVDWATEADALLVAARTGGDGLSLFRIDSARTDGLRLSPYRTIDGHPAADLIFEDHALPDDALIGPECGALDLLEEARDRALALLAAEAVGLLDSLLEQTIAYTGQRRQFGQPIAGFQALQHRMVDMYLECELARSSAWLAVEALDERPAARARAVSSAMVNIARACRLVGQEAIQLHGGMGMTDELPIGHYVKRAMAIEVSWADSDWHLARIAGL
ncbi:MAG: acyl-CoA dehydrogenase [Sphingopyxis sp.]|nr:acyl-CoA dehydrogenase [Sphingopyxis sp.]